jgi:hypothetical protein
MDPEDDRSLISLRFENIDIAQSCYYLARAFAFLNPYARIMLDAADATHGGGQ